MGKNPKLSYSSFKNPFPPNLGNSWINDPRENAENFVKENTECAGYPTLPDTIAKVERIIVIGDVHGDLNLVIKILRDEAKNCVFCCINFVVVIFSCGLRSNFKFHFVLELWILFDACGNYGSDVWTVFLDYICF